MKPGRIACAVPFCRRTHAGGPSKEYLCGRHWPLTDKRLRRVHTRIRREARKAGGYTPRLIRLELWVWARLKAQAIERAAGL